MNMKRRHKLRLHGVAPALRAVAFTAAHAGATMKQKTRDKHDRSDIKATEADISRTWVGRLEWMICRISYT